MLQRPTKVFCISIFLIADDINECDENPCLNDGTCVNENGYFYCECVTGFTGWICQTRIIQLIFEKNQLSHFGVSITSILIISIASLNF